MARAWSDAPAENEQHSSSQETKSDEEIESIAAESNQPQIPAATLSISSSDSEVLPEPSTPELDGGNSPNGNSPKRQKVTILTGMRRHAIR
jgi:hypothetical protein